MQPSTPIETPWLTLGESSAYAHRCEKNLRKAVKDGELRAARVGGRGQLLFRREWLDEWLEAQAPRPVLMARMARR